MEGREVSYKAQSMQGMPEGAARGMNVSRGEPTNVGWNSTGKGFETEAGAAEWRVQEQKYDAVREQRYDATRRGIGNLAMGQAQAYSTEVGQAQAYGYGPEMERVQGRGASEMKGVAGENLQQLEKVPEWMQRQNELVRERAEIESGFARKEVDPNLSSVGLASKTEEVYRQAMDKGNGEAEFRAESFDDKLQNKSQEEMGKVVATIVGKLKGRKSFVPNMLVKLRDEWMEKMLAAFKNPRKFKERN